MNSPVDLVLRNVRPHGGALCDIAISKGRVTAIGQRLSASAPEIDGQGRDIIPGLHDHHLHLFATAARRLTVDLSECFGHEAVVAALRRITRDLPDGAWLRATGLIEFGDMLPDRQMLDQWVDERPMRIQDRTGALWLLNSKAVRSIGPGPWPDCVECDISGMPTGRIWRGDAWLRSVLPSQLPSLRALSRELAAFGITAVTDAGATNGAQEAVLFEAVQQSGDLLQKLTLMGQENLPVSSIFERGPLKLLYDEPALPDVVDVAARIAMARQQGRIVAAHCVTLGELLYFLAALEAAGGAQSGDRIEHGSIIPQSLLADINRAGLTVVTQPGFIHTRGDRYLTTVEPHSLPDLYRLRSLMQAGIRVLAGSDAPYGNFDPWQAIKAAMTRTSQSGVVIGGADAITLRQSLGLFGANQLIETGMSADLCLLGTSLSELDRGICGNPVDMTFIDGEPFDK